MTVHYSKLRLWMSCDWEGCDRETEALLPDRTDKRTNVGWGFMRNTSDSLPDFHFCPDHAQAIINNSKIKEEIRKGKHLKSLQERGEFFE